MTWVVVAAAGRGERMGADLPKQYLTVAGRPLLAHTLQRLLGHPRIEGAVVVLAPGDRDWPGWTEISGKPLRTAEGGRERAQSVLAGLDALPETVREEDLVLVHDAARPCVRAEDIERLFEHAGADPVGGLLAAPVRDTLKRAGRDGHSRATEPREGLWRALTPQMFRRRALRDALAAALAAGDTVSDEAMAMERAGFRPRLVDGHEDNLKVTTAADLGIADCLLSREAGGDVAAPAGAATTQLRPRIGSGFDVHAFGAGDHVILGGVRIAHTRGLDAHSDGDVVIHALCDALLGALALGDIGRHFRPGDPRWAGIDSRHLLDRCVAEVRARGYVPGNADITVICEQPRLADHVDAMREVLAASMGIGVDDVGIKATTSERLGFTGRGEGIAAQATVLLVRG